MVTAATQQKREDLLTFIEVELAPHAAVQAVVGVGSIAAGLARPDSDIDAVLFLEPYDPYLVPAEFIWLPAARTFHSIFSAAPDVQAEGIQLDLARYALSEWADPEFEWPEPVRHGLRAGWVAFDRDGTVAELIAARTIYAAHQRRERLDEALVTMDLCLQWSEPEVDWAHLGAATALDRLQTAYDALVAALFAYNRSWRPFRSREMSHLLKLPWLPESFAARVLPALNAPALDYEGYVVRFRTLRDLLREVLAQLAMDDEYGADPVSRAFIRSHDEPGRAWNMDEWNRRHRLSYGTGR